MFSLDAELSEKEIAAARHIFEMVKECAGEIFGCPPVLLESTKTNSAGIYPNYAEFRNACYIITANILFTNWQQLGNHMKVARALSKITKRSAGAINAHLRGYKFSTNLNYLTAHLKHDEPISQYGIHKIQLNYKLLLTTNLVAHRLATFASAAPDFK